MCGLGIKIYAFELFLAGLAGLVVNSGLVCFRKPINFRHRRMASSLILRSRIISKNFVKQSVVACYRCNYCSKDTQLDRPGVQGGITTHTGQVSKIER